jgi:HSP20 family protein
MSSYFPFSVVDDRYRDLSRQFALRAAAQQPAWQPQVDIVENDTAWILAMDVPGVERDAIDITVDKQILTVRAERKIDYGENTTSSCERRAGESSRHFRLPESVDADNIAARIENGVLTLELPKRAKPEPRRITVQ